MGKLTHTHTFAELEVSAAAYDEIAGKLREAEYDHAFMDGGAIDMHGVGLIRATPVPETTEGEALRALERLVPKAQRDVGRTEQGVRETLADAALIRAALNRTAP